MLSSGSVALPSLLMLLFAATDAGVLLSRPVAISADHFEVYKKEHRAVYTGHAKAVRDDLTLTADQLHFFLGERDEVERIVAEGHVVAVEKDRQAFGERAEFINSTGVLTVTGQPHAKQGVREIKGERVVFTTGIDRLEVTRAHTLVREPEEQQLTIDSDMLTLEGPKNEATWQGHVRAFKVKTKTTLLTPKLIAHYDGAGEIVRVEAHGGAEVIEKDRWARGQDADYDVARGVLVVTGKPQARQGTSRMKGSKVTLYTGTDVLEVDNAVTVIESERKKP